MKNNNIKNNDNYLYTLSEEVRKLSSDGEFDKCEKLILDSMSKYPHSAEPHNLLGIILEKKGEHQLAMKHFRVAWELDPEYMPARKNLNTFGTFFSNGKYAFDENDCQRQESNSNYRLVEDSNHVTHIVKE